MLSSVLNVQSDLLSLPLSLSVIGEQQHTEEVCVCHTNAIFSGLREAGSSVCVYVCAYTCYRCLTGGKRWLLISGTVR